MDVSTDAQGNQDQDRKREEAKHQTNLKMDLLLIDLNVMGEAVKKYTTSTVLEDFMIVQAMKLRSEWRTQTTSLSKKVVEIKSAISQWGLVS